MVKDRLTGWLPIGQKFNKKGVQYDRSNVNVYIGISCVQQHSLGKRGVGY